MSRDPLTYQFLHSISNVPIDIEQPTIGMSDEEELRRIGLGLEGLGEEVLVDLKELGIVTDD